MARKTTTKTAVQHGPDFVGATPPDMAEQEARVNQALAEINDNATALAKQLGYEGSLAPEALENEIRFYQRRSVEACMALGACLLLLKEITPHGEFKGRVEALDMSYQMANKFMCASLKFSKVSSTRLLVAAGTQTKLLELLTLDEGEIAELSSGGSARGITLDEVDTMTVTDLRAALREAKADAEATGRVLEEKNAKLDKLTAENRKKKKTSDPWPDEVAGLKDDLHGLGKIMDEALGKHLTLIDATELEIDKHAEDEKSPAFAGYKTVAHHLGEQVERLCTLVAGLRHEYETRLSCYVDIDKTHIIPDAE